MSSFEGSASFLQAAVEDPQEENFVPALHTNFNKQCFLFKIQKPNKMQIDIKKLMLIKNSFQLKFNLVKPQYKPYCSQ